MYDVLYSILAVQCNIFLAVCIQLLDYAIITELTFVHEEKSLFLGSRFFNMSYNVPK